MVALICPEQLWDHQKNVIQKSWDKPAYAYFMEQGTGKTPTAVIQLRNLFQKHGRPLKTLIVCPAIVIDNWAREIEQWAPLCSKFVQPLTGSCKERIALLDTPGKHIFITNYEAFDMPELFWKPVFKLDKKTEKMVQTEERPLVDRGFEVLIADESHRLKNPTAKRTKLSFKIADKTAYRRILTGTPILQSPMDIWSQFRLLDGGASFGDNYYAFRNQWFVDKNAGMPSQRHFPNWQLKESAAADLHRLIYNKATRVEKKDCLDLPPLVMQQLYVELSREQRKHYEEMKRDFITYLGSSACTASIAITKALRMAQIVSGFLPVETENGAAKVQFNNCERLTALKDLLEDYCESGKVIVWAVFHQNYEQIAYVCRKLGLDCAMLTGQQNQKEKEKSVNDFTKGSLPVLIANPGAGGTGVNLTQAPVSIWYSRNFNLEHRLQALARNHRGGSEMHEKITCIDLVARDSLDVHILQALENKENIAQAILGWAAKI